MRSRQIREGSVGLLIIIGVILFGGLSIWLNRLRWGQQSYNFQVEFADANAMKSGAAVRYRGFEIGRITSMEPSANGVDVTVEINDVKLVIPKNVLIQANQAGLIGETSIDIQPLTELSASEQKMSPIAEDCNSNLIVCDNDRVVGEIGVSFGALLNSASRFSELYTDPVFFENLNSTAKNAGIAAAEIASLSQELSLLARDIRGELKNFSNAAKSIQSAANQTSRKISSTADRLAISIDEFSNTASKIGELADNANILITENRSNIQRTLSNIGDTSEQLNTIVANLSPAVAKVNLGVQAADTEKIAKNLEILTTNAADASANLRDITKNLNDPTNVLLLQQTLDAARVTFENAQKITSDLDELTGDPEFRNNLLNLVNGLSNLVSSTEQLEGQIRTAQLLESIKTQTEANSQIWQSLEVSTNNN